MHTLTSTDLLFFGLLLESIMRQMCLSLPLKLQGWGGGGRGIFKQHTGYVCPPHAAAACFESHSSVWLSEVSDVAVIL